MNSLRTSYDFGSYLSTHNLHLNDKSINPYHQIQILTQQRFLGKKEKNQGRNLTKDYQQYINEIIQPLLKRLALWCPDSPDFSFLPDYSWFLQFQFYLERPLLCKDDEVYYLVDNPIHKDKVFKVPFYPASSWKGRLRWVAYRTWVEKDGSAEGRFTLRQLFGDEMGEKECGKFSAYLDRCHPESKTDYQLLLHAMENDKEPPSFEGRLHFYQTFFNRIDIEVINPHDRKKKAGRWPVFFESIPQGAEGIFSLLFIPYHTSNKMYSINQMNHDLEVINNAIRAMFLDYGFGAKTSSGFGIAKPEIRGKFQIKANIDPIDIKSFYNLCGLSEKVSRELNSRGDEDGCRS